MNEALIQRRTSHTDPCRVAAQGLEQLGYSLVWFDDDSLPAGEVRRDCLVVAGVGVLLRALQQLGIAPSFPTYPEPLRDFMASHPRGMTLEEARRIPAPYFLKPAAANKVFAGIHVMGAKDLIATAAAAPETEILVVAATSFVSEFRCFVRSGDVIGCRHYKGDPLVFPEAARIKQMARTWQAAPAAWALDVGVTAAGETLMVEANDAHSIGDYGLPTIAYARFLEARWCELTGSAPIP